MLIDHPASELFHHYQANNCTTSLSKFLGAVRQRFDPTYYENYVGLLSKLSQTTTVMDYQSEYEAILNKVPGVPESSLIAMYVAGLKQPVQREVNHCNPTTLLMEFTLARELSACHQEVVTTYDSGSCRARSTRLPPSIGEGILPMLPSYGCQPLATSHSRDKPANLLIAYLTNAEKARKALRALKGLVRLQAIIRGRAVRRQTIDTLKRLQSIVSIQSELHAQSCNLVKNTADLQEKQYQDIKIDMNSHRGWDNRILSKEEANAMFLSKMDAAIKRERIREYWLTHRRSSEGEWRPQIKQRYWLEQWVDAQLAKREDLVNLDTDICAGARMRNEFEQRESKTISLRQYRSEGTPRRSFQHKRQHSIGDDSPRVSRSVPTYMAATESAKAKARSLSSPRMRPMKFDAYSDINSPYKYKLSPISSINSEMTVKSKVLNPSSLSQRSPCLKSIAAPVRSSRSLKNVRLESDF
ncbi:unnamed protein product [Cuscuta campestris]|uniref:Uncharacterized protein n=1 Tax=Cuscuta campestris TaxID=132261 RepID=A0A484KDY3_9ASTE|nr:unnamed protein product [Cuscuta campestris]